MWLPRRPTTRPARPPTRAARPPPHLMPNIARPADGRLRHSAWAAAPGSLRLPRPPVPPSRARVAWPDRGGPSSTPRMRRKRRWPHKASLPSRKAPHAVGYVKERTAGRARVTDPSGTFRPGPPHDPRRRQARPRHPPVAPGDSGHLPSKGRRSRSRHDELIAVFVCLDPVSDAHLNPVVTLAFALRGLSLAQGPVLTAGAKACVTTDLVPAGRGGGVDGSGPGRGIPGPAAG